MRYPHRPVRVRAELIEGYAGKQMRDWDNATRRPFAANVQPLSSDEDVSSRDTTTTRWRLFAPPPTGGLLSTDRVEHGDLVLEVDGDVEDWGARTSRRHLEAVLLKVTDR